jgi:pectate lyase
MPLQDAGLHAAGSGTSSAAGAAVGPQAGVTGTITTSQAGTSSADGGQPSTAGSAAGAGVAGANAGAGTSGSAGSGAGGASAGGAGGGKANPSDCTMPPPADAVIGWASVSGGTQGGGMATPTMVTSFDALKSGAAGTQAATLWIKGSITGDLTLGSNKTLIGLCGAEFHGHVELSGSSNVIIRNLKIVGYGVGDCSKDPTYDASVGCSSGQDAMSIQKSAHNIWIDHCDISDGTDGNLDITNAADNVTVSWTKFHYTPRTDNAGNDSTGAEGHRFSNLVGGTDSPSTDDAHTLNVTWHHDWWADNVVERQPRVRFGKNHLFNNLWTSTQSNYCVRAGKQAQVWVEKGVFFGVKSPLQFNSTSDQGTANITSTDNVFTNTSGDMATGGGGPALTSVPYQYTPDPAQGLEQAIRNGAGPR